jgi:NADH-quinone oxidoreductase subunit M
MVSHGVVTGALFFLVGMLDDRAHTREMERFGGLLKYVPFLGWSFVLAAFASLGLPGLAHFPAEFQIFLATLREEPAALVMILGIVITAGLYLRAIGKVFFGEPNEQWAGMETLNTLEVLTLAPLLILIILIGVAPSWLLGTIHQTTMSLHY